MFKIFRLFALCAVCFVQACAPDSPIGLTEVIEAGSDVGVQEPFGATVLSEIPGPMAEYLDGRRPGGDPGFIWEPPLVRRRTAIRGQFNPRVTGSLAVQVCEWDTECASVEHRVPGASSGPVNSFVRLNANREFYTTSWSPDPSIEGGTLFRAEAYLHAFELGWVELMAVTNFPELFDAWRRGLTPFVPGWPVTIRFRVHDGVFEGVHNPVPILDVFDGRDDGGNPQFHFVPPVQRPPDNPGTFDPDQRDNIQVFICGWVGTGCIAPIATIQGRSGPNRIRRNRGQGFYEARWDTQGMDPTMNYRATVFLGGVFMGHADIDLVQAGFDCAPSAPQDTYCREVGQPARIRFRLDQAP